MSDHLLIRRVLERAQSQVGGGSGGGGGDDPPPDALHQMLMCIAVLSVVLYGCCKPRTGVNTGQGDRIRRIARERRAENEERKRREEQPEDKRSDIVGMCLRTKKVVSKNERGDLRLGPVDSIEGSDSTDEDEDEEDPEAAAAAAAAAQEADDYDEEEQVCQICLDSFEVGDVVSWSKYSPHCQHVFHDDCIKQWLLERRQDDCPSCRSKLVMYDYSQPESPVRENLQSVLGDSFDDEQGSDESDGGGDDDDGAAPRARAGMFTIVSGLISAAAKRGGGASSSSSYAPVKGTDSMEEEEESGGNGGGDLSAPKPLRRVASIAGSSSSSFEALPLRRVLSDPPSPRASPRSDDELPKEEEKKKTKRRSIAPADAAVSARSTAVTDSDSDSSEEEEEGDVEAGSSPTDLPSLDHPFCAEEGGSFSLRMRTMLDADFETSGTGLTADQGDGGRDDASDASGEGGGVDGSIV